MWRRPLGYGAAVVGALALAVFVGWWRVDGPGAPPSNPPLPSALTAMDFRLTDHEGNGVEPASLLGRPSMIFFGFTYCPDVCPTTLSDISGWLDALGNKADDLDVVFITVDPARDTVEAMAEYAEHFHPAIRGWTGSAEDIERAAEGFRVIFEKVAIEGRDYTMNHTASVFLYGADGRFVGTIDYHEAKDVALPKLRRLIEKSRANAT